MAERKSEWQGHDLYHKPLLAFFCHEVNMKVEKKVRCKVKFVCLCLFESSIVSGVMGRRRKDKVKKEKEVDIIVT